MIALLAILAASLAIVAWNLCAMIRDAAHDNALRRRLDELCDERAYGDIPHVPSAWSISPHDGEDIAR